MEQGCGKEVAFAINNHRTLKVQEIDSIKGLQKKKEEKTKL